MTDQGWWVVSIGVFFPSLEIPVIGKTNWQKEKKEKEYRDDERNGGNEG